MIKNRKITFNAVLYCHRRGIETYFKLKKKYIYIQVYMLIVQCNIMLHQGKHLKELI